MSELILQWHGHACFELSYAGHSLVIDPYYQVPGYPKLALEAGQVFASHTQHDDHGYFDAVTLVEQPGENPFSVETVDTFHDGEGGSLRGNNKMTIFEAGGVRVAHVGDLGHELSEEQLEAIRGVDMALIPVGGFYTIDGVQAAALAKACGASIVVPMHFRRDGRGFDVIAEPEVFLNALDGGIETMEADDGMIRVKDRQAFLCVKGEERCIGLGDGRQHAVVLNFSE
ncbi:MAG: MBL fold metallo-hydrolase [Anaerovoracaceae bacterium]